VGFCILSCTFPQCDFANNWTQYGSNCYRLKVDTRKSWASARYDCVQDGGDLVSIASAEEEQFLPDFHQVDIPDIWIGLSDKDQDGVFKWVDKTAITFSNYAPGWPKNTYLVNLCFLPGNYEGKWETTNCFKLLGYICEMTGGQNPKPTSAPG
uniref:C-type lectin domain-containing protein n=1 Tax=Monopterus albus TaxID=43700 RepID=A0A3Q3IFE0_MONAL